MATSLKLVNLSHRYSTSWAIRDINFEIDSNGVVGLLGSNGAGKSTTMNIMCGVLSQTSGEVYINGIDIRKDPNAAKKYIGFLPQTAPLYADLTVDEYLTFCAYMRLMDKASVAKAVSEAKDLCGIGQHSKRLIGNLSGGYRQRVGIAQAIIHHPKLVVMDEPTNGLDPNQIIEVRNLIKDIAQDRVVIFSSHVLSEVQLICKEIKMIESGRLVFSDTIESFNSYIQPNSVQLLLGNPPAEADLLALPGITRVEFLTSHRIRVFNDGDLPLTEQLVEHSITYGWRLQEIFPEKSSMNEVFAQLSQKS